MSLLEPKHPWYNNCFINNKPYPPISRYPKYNYENPGWEDYLRSKPPNSVRSNRSSQGKTIKLLNSNRTNKNNALDTIQEGSSQSRAEQERLSTQRKNCALARLKIYIEAIPEGTNLILILYKY
jgi:hypothetical protein